MMPTSEPQARLSGTRIPFVTLASAEGISQTGNALTMLAIPWFVLETTGSAALTGITASVNALAIVVAGLFGGGVVDRLGARRTSIVGDLGGGAAVAFIPLLDQTVGLAFWQLLGLVFVGALLRSPGWAARRSLYAIVAGLANVRLERANATSQLVGRLAGLGGPLLAGVLIAARGPTFVLWLDAATFLVSATLVALGIPRSTVTLAERAASAETRKYKAELLAGWRFIRGNQIIRWLIVVGALGSLLAEPVHAVIYPVYANQVFGSALDLGLMFAGLAVGAILANVLYLVFAPRLPRRAIYIIGFAVRDLGFWVLVLMPPLEVIVATIAIQAIFLEPTNAIGQTVLQERIPEALRGRVFATILALEYGARSLGLLLYGLVLQETDLRDTLVVLAAVNVIVPVVILAAPAFRTMARPRSATAH